MIIHFMPAYAFHEYENAFNLFMKVSKVMHITKNTEIRIQYALEKGKTQ